MILVDANLLLFATNSTLAHHNRARTWLEERLNGGDRVGLPWASLLAFMRIATNHRIFNPPWGPRTPGDRSRSGS